MKIHCCLFDKDCKKYDAPPRLHINNIFGRWSIVVALWPNAKTMGWSPGVGYHGKFRWISITPKYHITCVGNGGPRGCGRLANHRGPHVTPLTGIARNKNLKWRKNILIFDADGMKQPQSDT